MPLFGETDTSEGDNAQATASRSRGLGPKPSLTALGPRTQRLVALGLAGSICQRGEHPLGHRGATGRTRCWLHRRWLPWLPPARGASPPRQPPGKAPGRSASGWRRRHPCALRQGARPRLRSPSVEGAAPLRPGQVRRNPESPKEALPTGVGARRLWRLQPEREAAAQGGGMTRFSFPPCEGWDMGFFLFLPLPVSLLSV